MCGIVGYVGYKKAYEVLLNGLSKLEYRGYDSSGVCLSDKNSVKIFKSLGKLCNLKELIEKNREHIEDLNVGIGHTRWATHGAATEINAHPHTCNCGNLAVVHNGIIENFKELKEELMEKGCKFKSQTDTETIAHLIAQEYLNVKSLTKATSRAVQRLKGAYALCIVHKNEPGVLVAVRKNAPLLIGLSENENFVASDVPAIIDHTKRVIYLDDEEIATLTSNTVLVSDLQGRQIVKKEEILPFEPQTMSKMGYKHFMIKEIFEQSDVIRNILQNRLIDIDKNINLEEIKFDNRLLKDLKRIEIIACGTSLHAAQIAKFIIEDFANIAVDVESSSEYIYRRTVTDKNTLVIGVSQSGETADTITAIKQAKEKGSHIVIMTNRADSTMARMADSLISVNAGIEVSVAATKSFMAQLVSFYLLALFLSEKKGTLSIEKLKYLKKEILQLPSKIDSILSNVENVKECARRFANTKDFIYIARGVNYPIALEGALKLKEISYINATGYPAGELKHGPIAMLDSTMPVLAILMQGNIIFEKIFSNCEEAKARHAKLIALTDCTDENIDNLFDFVLKVPHVDHILSPILTCVPLQLIAYYIAEFLGKDVDQPRNLAKSVTVE